MNCLITFIVPVYKVNYKQLKKCINSILNQTEKREKYEVLMVDDGSPDECPAICDEYKKNYDNVHVIHQKNQGLSVVRNNGVSAALGKWITFVDGDDWIEPDFVKFAELSITRAPADVDIMIWDGYSETRNSSKPIKFMDNSDTSFCTFSGKKKELLIDRILPRYVRKEDIERCTDLGITWGRIYRRDFLIDNKIENVPGLRVMQDSVFNLWAFEYARTICYQYKPIYHYSMYDESISKKFDPEIAETMRTLYGYFSEYIKKCHNNDDYWQRLYIRTVRLLVKCLAKDYANPLNKDPLKKRKEKLKRDLNCIEFQTALKKCKYHGQELKFKIILFLLKHKMYTFSICASKLFGKIRRLKNTVS